ncbi:MAG: YceD family protein [Proteobacteria bacterium]|nr:YceD family protein [Pseudomonadota bacterium]
MSSGPADQVNAKELSARAAVIERHLDLPQLERVVQAGGLPGTRIDARLQFGACEGRTTVDVRVEGTAVLECQRCLQPCEVLVDESALVVIVRAETDDVLGGYEPFVGEPESVSLSALIEEQVLLALPLVPVHEAGSPECLWSEADVAALAPASAVEPAAAEAAVEKKQTPFANLRELLEKNNERGPASGE